MSEHDFDRKMYYCRRCGMALQDAVGCQSFECVASENVIAISHIVRGRILARLIGDDYGR
ncbi:hypothetical protein EN828_10545 [Mesorhizobium sp. M2D.F.Ca.ET.185.01.1.1]|uniref:hypothetical protein n=1 Tax=unclassified Mesorhizobium TaxID=325217 RepID=UPI000FCCA1B8|nr:MULTISPECIES: hypothetical protein [unclassified Mesorhizobium]TGT96201.1 hypothetical protein EN806_52625 [bacterium M00.F.Ca.ET.163.01.1.1]TGV81408.1 hypothetical protein EN792_034720 [Mesorhizobium sp. M00.F.Ca.ET.149.01.1.1]TGP33511.1 hypothetical protein EN875_016400 [Mesorhizobium sp. M2D.F.Ca.ET.232.01.1.1]TGQ24907.1 hypothetical protein EN863_059985 [Mesorhizobium sp. M00.F.Ca.ET.220.01.1.1]TGQ89475.1 hypothetical protein EN849_10045 [Mesorhizobium sp. M2D.F.Ca.ET.206.01.1.1]